MLIRLLDRLHCERVLSQGLIKTPSSTVDASASTAFAFGSSFLALPWRARNVLAATAWRPAAPPPGGPAALPGPVAASLGFAASAVRLSNADW